MSTEEELIGGPIDNVPQREPGEKCNARRSKKKGGERVFVGYCKNPAGKNTEHFGDGRCSNHGGCSPRGEESPHFEHGLYSDYLSEEDREELEAIDARGNLANLQSTINFEFLRLRRAVRHMEEQSEEEESESFWDAYNRIIREAAASGLGSEEIGALAELLDSSYTAFNERIESIRRLVKTYEELTEGRKVNIDGEYSHTHTGEEGGAPIQIEWKESRAEANEEVSDDAE